MAKGLYLGFHAKWDLRPFQNVAERGETHHLAAVRAELKARGAEERIPELAPGSFSTEELQAFHDRLAAAGAESVEGAIRSAIEFEEHDIALLRADMAKTQDARLKELLAFLEMGSLNHLRAFHRQAEMRGIVYEPKHLDAEAFAAALAGATAVSTPDDAPAASQAPAGDARGTGAAGRGGRGQGRQARQRGRASGTPAQ